MMSDHQSVQYDYNAGRVVTFDEAEAIRCVPGVRLVCRYKGQLMIHVDSDQDREALPKLALKLAELFCEPVPESIGTDT